MKRLLSVAAALLCLVTITGCGCSHEWKEATCLAPKTCSECGKTEGEPGEHSWSEASCTTPESCTLCGMTRGEELGHTWASATCQQSQTCSVCGETQGQPLAHSWSDANCTQPETCADCGEIGSEPLGHDWQEATVLAPKTCSRCGETEGEKLEEVVPPSEGTPRYAEGRFLLTPEEIATLYLDALADRGFEYQKTYTWVEFEGLTTTYYLESSNGHGIYLMTIKNGFTNDIYYVSAKCESGEANLSDPVMKEITELIFEVCHGAMTEEKWDFIHQRAEKAQTELGQLSSCTCDELGYWLMEAPGRCETCAISDLDIFNDGIDSMT